MTANMPAFDPAALRAKYDLERDKRLRADGNDQYVHLEEHSTHFLDDPYTPREERAPVTRDVEVVILGGGFGGLLTAGRLSEAGIDDFLVIEKGGDFGGTWYWNRYPGAACDVESYVYLPLLEETGYMPSEKYAGGEEIYAYSRKIGEKYGLYDKALFQTLIDAFRWDESSGKWIVETDRGDDIEARYVIVCAGHYQNPKLPGIPGVLDFKGHSFHTSRWDYDYTGGNQEGGLDKLKDKTVAIIGTGATAVQCIPHLGRSAKQLYVFQRTPSSVDLRGDRPTDAAWFNALEPGWQKARMDNFIALTSGIPVERDMIDDSWTKPMFRALSEGAGKPIEQFYQIMQMNDFSIMEGVRARVAETVADVETAEALKPWYNRLCKRPCFHDHYLPTFNRPNVTLVDTEGRGVERITERGLVVDGNEYPVDCIVFATGFDLAAYSGLAVPVYGRDGQSLADKWREGATTLHGMHVHGFPNLFIVGTTQSAWGANFPHMMEEQARHIAYVLGELKRRGATRVEVTEAAEAEWVARHEAESARLTAIWAECTPSYFNNEGQPSPAISRNGGFGSGVIPFVQILEGWRADGQLAGLELQKAV